MLRELRLNRDTAEEFDAWNDEWLGSWPLPSVGDTFQKVRRICDRICTGNYSCDEDMGTQCVSKPLLLPVIVVGQIQRQGGKQWACGRDHIWNRTYPLRQGLVIASLLIRCLGKFGDNLANLKQKCRWLMYTASKAVLSNDVRFYHVNA